MREAFDATEIFPANLSLSSLVADEKKRTQSESRISGVRRSGVAAPAGRGRATRREGVAPPAGRGRATRRIGVMTNPFRMRSGQLDPIARRDIFGPKRRTAAGAGTGYASEN